MVWKEVCNVVEYSRTIPYCQGENGLFKVFFSLQNSFAKRKFFVIFI